ncbi:flagellar protein FlgN [Alcaligenaceae bacterium SJ-26]|nr:flagellar protein FlgN [Alcaligenaceae bacterium SJ-26]
MTAHTIQDLSAALAQEAELVEQFVDVLLQESNLLNGVDTLLELNQIAEKKQTFANRLEDCAKLRLELLQSLNLSADNPEVPSDSALEYAEIKACWDRLMIAADKASEQNRHNGIIISVHRQYIDDSLAALRKAQRSNQLYDAQGKTKAIRQRRPGVAG